MKKVSPRLLVASVLGLGLIVAFSVAYGPIGKSLELLVGAWQNAIAVHLRNPHLLHGPALYVTAFVGGLVASLSPCILGMLPINLSYIGALAPKSRGAALMSASAFVFGVITVNSAIGLASSLFFAIVVQYRAQLNVAVGAFAVVLGLWLLGVVRVPFASPISSMPKSSGPYVVGLAFALIASPCASPILVFVLSAVSLDPSPIHAVVAMILYSIGYTAVLFAASLIAGLAIASRRLLAYGDMLTRVAAAMIILIGIGTIIYGVSQW